MIVLDTNVVSELMRPSPAGAVQAWLGARHGSKLYTTSITLAEIRYGIDRLPGGRRKNQLRTTADDLFDRFAEQVLPFDAAATGPYASIVTMRDRTGRPIDGFDAQIAAICRARSMALATRNIADFDDTGVELIDPWRTG